MVATALYDQSNAQRSGFVKQLDLALSLNLHPVTVGQAIKELEAAKLLEIRLEIRPGTRPGTTTRGGLHYHFPASALLHALEKGRVRESESGLSAQPHDFLQGAVIIEDHDAEAIADTSLP